MECHRNGDIEEEEEASGKGGESVDEASDNGAEKEHEGSGKDGEPVVKAPDNNANGTETNLGKLFSFAFDVVPH